MFQDMPRGAFGGAVDPRIVARSGDQRGRVMLVAPPPELVPPLPFANSLLHRLRILVVRHDEVPDVPPSRILGELPQLEAQAMGSTHSRPLRHSRRLQGEILCDGAGRLYEKIGHYVQPIHQLVAGPSGEVLDLAPPRSLRSRDHDTTLDAAVNHLPDIELAVDQDASTPKADQPDAARLRERRAETTGWRELPDVRSRIVPFGEFRNVLATQIAQPNRLRDTHLLSCCVHIYESCRKQRAETRAAVQGCTPGQLLTLTATLAARLDLTDLLPRCLSPDREVGVVLPGDRVVRLEVVDDPTAAIPRVTNSPRTAAAEPESRAAAVPPAREPRRKTIPERFLLPWQFALSREEAIYDLNLEATQPLLRSWIQRLWTAPARRRELRKWQSLLNGRSLEDQLWGVRPPGSSVSDPVIRAWAHRMLEAAGYDAAAMLFEWDVYWLRKRR